MTAYISCYLLLATLIGSLRRSLQKLTIHEENHKSRGLYCFLFLPTLLLQRLMNKLVQVIIKTINQLIVLSNTPKSVRAYPTLKTVVLPQNPPRCTAPKPTEQ